MTTVDELRERAAQARQAAAQAAYDLAQAVAEEEARKRQARLDAMAAMPPSQQLSEWRPIAELQPVLGERYILLWPTGGWGVAMWKTNDRLDPQRFQKLTDEEKEWLSQFRQPYFGNEVEMDDYDYARPEEWPTHYLPVPKLPEI